MIKPGDLVRTQDDTERALYTDENYTTVVTVVGPSDVCLVISVVPSGSDHMLLLLANDTYGWRADRMFEKA